MPTQNQRIRNFQTNIICKLADMGYGQEKVGKAMGADSPLTQLQTNLKFRAWFEKQAQQAIGLGLAHQIRLKVLYLDFSFGYTLNHIQNPVLSYNVIIYNLNNISLVACVNYETTLISPFLSKVSCSLSQESFGLQEGQGCSQQEVQKCLMFCQSFERTKIGKQLSRTNKIPTFHGKEKHM